MVMMSGVTPKRSARERRAQPAEAGDHLVEDQQDAVPVADRPQPLQIAVRRQQHAGRAGDRLDDHRGDGLGAVQRDERSSASARCAPHAGWPRLKALRSGGVGVRQVIDAGQHGAELAAVGADAADRDAAEADAVIAALAADQPRAPASPRAR